MRHFFIKHCERCGRDYKIRRPNTVALVIKAIQLLRCPYCYPKDLKNCCASCRFPFDLAGHHSGGMCSTCAQSHRRYKKRLNANV